MKKYFFIVVIMTLSFNAFAQKKLLIYNLSANDITINDIFTKHSTNAYPQVVDNASPILVPAGESLELIGTHLTRFPFSQLVGETWVGITSATTSTGALSGGATEIAYGSGQVFHCIKFYDGYASGVLGTSPMGINEVELPDTLGIYEEFLIGTVIEYTIVFL